MCSSLDLWIFCISSFRHESACYVYWDGGNMSVVCTFEHDRVFIDCIVFEYDRVFFCATQWHGSVPILRRPVATS